MNKLKASYLMLLVEIICFVQHGHSQALPDVPFDLNFAGVTVHLTEPGREHVKQELAVLYNNRARLYKDIEYLRQLTPFIEPLLTEQQLPMDFRYVYFPFDTTNQYGYWALQTAQVKEFNLRVSNEVDERFHPLLTTEVVTSHLRRLQDTNGNYVLTLLQHLQTPASLTRRSSKIDPNYWLLDPASPSLMWKVLARKIAFEREEPVLRLSAFQILYDYRNSGGQSLDSIAHQCQVSTDRLQPFNKWLLVDKVPTEKDYPVLIRVTADEITNVKRLVENRWKAADKQEADMGFPMLAKLPNQETGTRSSAVFYVINERRGVQAQSCDNAITLAYYGKISPEAFMKYNELGERDVVRPGEIYYLEPKAKRAKVPFHVVRKGQTLRDVSTMYGVQLKWLLWFNHIEPTQRVQTGRILWMQERRPDRRPIEYQQPTEEKPLATQPVVVTQTEQFGASSDTLAQLPSNVPTTESDNQTEAVAQPGDETTVASNQPNVFPNASSVNEPTASPDEPKDNLKIHVVQPGQSYSVIAKLYGVTVQQLYAWNNLSEQLPLLVGQELILDTSKKAVQPKPKNPTAVKPKRVATSLTSLPAVQLVGKELYYVVKPGQTIYRVALINRVTIADLMRWNGLKDYTIEIGQRLLIRK